MRPCGRAVDPMASAPERLLRRLEWQVVRRLDGRLQGAYRTVFRGTGIDFTDLRGYTPEDDVRHIDWNVTARLDEPVVVEDRADPGAAMCEEPAEAEGELGQHAKGAELTELAIGPGRLFTHGGIRVGAILYDNRF